MAKQDPLKAYKSKRDFAATPEPADGGLANESERVFVVQKHWARRLHYDFRLELGGTMKSWAVPKGPSFDPADKRMAMHVEDHPLSYNTFEGQIPQGHYGAGKVMVWDRGIWQALGDPRAGYKKGKIVFRLHGRKLRGRWALIRMKGKSEKRDPWLLIKEKDEYARPASEFSVVDEMPDSVLNGGIDNRKAHTPEHTEQSQNIQKTIKTTIKQTGSQVEKKQATTSSDKKEASKPSGKKEDADNTDKKLTKNDVSSAKQNKALPLKLTPQLATLAKEPPSDAENWLYEFKFDGYRLLTRVASGRAALFTRNCNDWSRRLPGLVKRLDALKLPAGWYDGEIVVMNAQGKPDFQMLQNAFDTADTAGVDYFLFDMPFFDGQDLRAAPLIERRSRLKAVLEERMPTALGDHTKEHIADTVTGTANSEPSDTTVAAPRIRFSDTFDAPGRDLLTAACKLGLEGVIAKRKDSPYVSRRSGDWVKLKCSLRQEFVIGGYTAPQGSRSAFGSLLLGVYDRAGALRYAGNVGTGFNEATLASVHKALKTIKASSSPFSPGTKIGYRDVSWVKPQLVAEVSFAEWTKSGNIRQAVFHGLRTDKPARQITRETAETAEAPMAQTHSLTPLLNQQKVTHPERIIDTSTKTTKADLVRYYALIAPLILPHLKGRPVSFLRAPQGIGQQTFFQKHMGTARMAGVRQLPQSLDPDHDPLMEIARDRGLLSAGQMNVIEFHTWNAVKTAIVRPDRMVFDLDPGKGTDWSAVQEAALLLRVFLTELELVPFIKTSGGKGLHVVVPLQRRHDWDVVKDFSHHVVKHLARTFPDRFTAKSGPRNRVGKIFIDYLRNGFGATTVCAWSARARPGMAVSVPLDWREVESLSGPDRWRVANIHERLDVGNDPWRDYDKSARTLTAGRRVLAASN